MTFDVAAEDGDGDTVDASFAVTFEGSTEFVGGVGVVDESFMGSANQAS